MGFHKKVLELHEELYSTYEGLNGDTDGFEAYALEKIRYALHYTREQCIHEFSHFKLRYGIFLPSAIETLEDKRKRHYEAKKGQKTQALEYSNIDEGEE